MHIALALIFVLNSFAAVATPLASSRNPVYTRLDRCQATLKATLEIDDHWVPVNIDHYQHSLKIKRAVPATAWPSRKTRIDASPDDYWKYTVDDIFVIQNRMFALIENQQKGTGTLEPILLEFNFKTRDTFKGLDAPYFGNFAFLLGGLSAGTLYHRLGIPQSGAALYVFAGSVAAVATVLIQWSSFMFKIIQSAKRKVLFDHATVLSGQGQGAREMDVLRDPETGLVTDIVLQPGNDPRDRYLLSARLAKEAHARDLLPAPPYE